MHKELLKAIENKNTSEAISIINKLSSEELDKIDHYGSTIFDYAIKYNCNNKDEKIFNLLIQKMSMIGLCNKSSNFDGGTVLHTAAQTAWGPVCIKLINKIGTEGVKIVNSRGVTVLHYAAKSRLNEVCKIIVPMLTQHELEYKDLYNNTALHLLIKSELSDTAILVISRISREAIEHSNDHNYTPLQYAAKLGLVNVCIELVKQMNQKGIEFKSPYGKNGPALSMAAYEKHIEICKLLASHMSIPAIEDCDYKGTNILEFVKSNSHSEKDRKIAEIIEARIQRKDITLINCDSLNTSQLSKFQQLILLIKANNTEESINLITRMKYTELKEGDKDGRTILHWIAETNNIKLANVVLKKLPNLIGIEDYYENTPLILAEIHNSESCVNLLKNFTGSTTYDGDQHSVYTLLAGGLPIHDS